MENRIFNGHHRFCLKVIGVWPGSDRLWPVVFVSILGLFFIFSATLNLMENWDDLEIVSENLIDSTANLATTVALIYLRSKRR